VDYCSYGCHGVYARVRLGFCAVFADPVSYPGKGEERANPVLGLSDFGLRICIVYGHFLLRFSYPFFPLFGGEFVEQMFKMVTCLEKPWLASLYLAVPYLTMLSVDLCEGRRKPKIGLARDEGNTEFMRFKGQGFETARGNPYEAGVTTEGELMVYVERGWEVIMELSDGRYVIRRKTSVERSLISYFLRKISDSTRLKT